MLVSDTRTPVQPDLAAEWTGVADRARGAGAVGAQHHAFRSPPGLQGHQRSTFAPTPDSSAVGYRDTYVKTATRCTRAASCRACAPGLANRRRSDRRDDPTSGAAGRRHGRPGQLVPAVSGPSNDVVRSGVLTFPRQQFLFTADPSPWRVVSQLALDGSIARDRLADSRLGRGATVESERVRSIRMSPSELALLQDQRSLNIESSLPAPGGCSSNEFANRGPTRSPRAASRG